MAAVCSRWGSRAGVVGIDPSNVYVRGAIEPAAWVRPGTGIASQGFRKRQAGWPEGSLPVRAWPLASSQQNRPRREPHPAREFGSVISTFPAVNQLAGGAARDPNYAWRHSL